MAKEIWQKGYVCIYILPWLLCLIVIDDLPISFLIFFNPRAKESLLIHNLLSVPLNFVVVVSFSALKLYSFVPPKVVDVAMVAMPTVATLCSLFTLFLAVDSTYIHQREKGEAVHAMRLDSYT